MFVVLCECVLYGASVHAWRIFVCEFNSRFLDSEQSVNCDYRMDLRFSIFFLIHLYSDDGIFCSLSAAF